MGCSRESNGIPPFLFPIAPSIQDEEQCFGHGRKECVLVDKSYSVTAHTAERNTYIDTYHLFIMNWTKLLYVLIIVLLYTPMVFLGANVFFPEYTGANAHYQGLYLDCYGKHPYPQNPDTLTGAERTRIDELQRECSLKNQEEQRAWENKKLVYEGTKYVFVALFNLVILLLALFVPKLQDSVTMGLFLGSIGATFGATIRYFDTRSRIGFIILVVTFFAMLFFINRKKDSFVDWEEKKKK